ncbi:hypothetical protein [Lewinella sp. JB7]|uniref:hypothetical protein n=1 Tax=Lewinella sp. JB7 TaxID=2962887 RepID=UPI0020C9E608|nr:hypothetical protein [Lewinella sp. JB7]MCP9234346.1 hypothetical protein [Lewinella sp. JB7]
MKALLSLLCLLIFGCSPRLAEGVHLLKVDEPVHLLSGESAKTRKKSLELITFVEVLEDSRCPTGVQCIQAGRAVVGLRVLRNGILENQSVTIDGEGLMVTDGGTLRLVGLEPYPDAAVEEPEPYRLVVRLMADERER